MAAWWSGEARGAARVSNLREKKGEWWRTRRKEMEKATCGGETSSRDKVFYWGLALSPMRVDMCRALRLEDASVVSSG
jgi:hypothetical protein